MITIIEDHNREEHRYLLDAMFKQRARVFGPEGLHWDVQIDNWGWETDDLDDEHPVYVIAHRYIDLDDHTSPPPTVMGSLRLLPTTGPTLLERVFPHSSPVRISAPDIWEMTRLCIEGKPRERRRTLLELFAAVGRIAQRSAINTIIGNVTVAHFVMYERIGIPIELIGGHKGVEIGMDEAVVLVSIPINAAIPAVAFALAAESFVRRRL
jgi:N-acyl-L-homoserine lactone synthetase